MEKRVRSPTTIIEMEMKELRELYESSIRHRTVRKPKQQCYKEQSFFVNCVLILLNLACEKLIFLVCIKLKLA